MLTSDQIRAARGLLRWSAEDLARKSGVGLSTIRRMEGASGVPAASARNLAAIQRALEEAGVELIPEGRVQTVGVGVGVRLRERAKVEAEEEEPFGDWLRRLAYSLMPYFEGEGGNPLMWAQSVLHAMHDDEVKAGSNSPRLEVEMRARKGDFSPYK